MIDRMSHRVAAEGRAPGAAVLATLLVLASGCGAERAHVSIPPPPESRVEPVAETLHGVEVVDPYRWLEDQQAPETREWIERENGYTDAVFAQLPGREVLREKVASLIQIDTVSLPTARGDRYFFTKRHADQDLRVLYLRQGLDGEDQVLLDPHGWSEDHTTSLDLLDVSKDGKAVAYGVREGGQDEIAIRLFDVEARSDLPDALPKGRYFGVSFTPDGSGLFYVRHDPREGPRVFFHELGADPAADRMIFGQGYGPEKLILADLSPDGRYLVITVLYGSAADKSELYLKDVAAGGPVRVVVDDIDARFGGSVIGDWLVMQTNWQAPNGRVLVAPAGDPARERWREIIPERQDAVIRGVSEVGGRLFVSYLQDVRSRIEAFDLEGEALGEIQFDGLGTVGGVSGEWDRDEAFFVFTSFHIPTTIYRYQVSTGERGIWDRAEIPIDTSGFEVRQDFYTSKDGTRVPMFLVHKKGIVLDGSNPTLLSGYGGFNLSLTPRFNPATALWVESGGVFALANLRGGGEYGEAWHRAGMRENKQNVFDDFIAAAQWLTDQGYTRPERLAVQGGSNGGLLVGALLTQRPDLVAAVVCSYPLLDMVRYHKFLVAGFWVPEYGSAEDPEQLPYLLAYSPYHNVKEGADYPAVLFITGDGDTRVAPLHARKMAARMQAATGSDEPVLLRYHIKAGHAGGQPVGEQIDNTTDSMSFLMWQLGMEAAATPEVAVAAGG